MRPTDRGTPRRRRPSIPGRIAAAITSPRKKSESSTRSFQSASASATLRAVWRWERTRVLVTTEKLVVVHGTLKRRTTALRLERIGAIEVEQGVVARVFGYGTLVAGPLSISHVPQPRQVYALVE